MNRIKPAALLFDLDGVLVDSEDSWYHAFRELFRSNLHRELGKDEFLHDYWGLDVEEIAQRTGLAVEIAPFCNTVYRNHTGKTTLYPDTKKTLERLDGYKKALITNAPEDCARQLLRRFHIEAYFESIVTADSSSEGKPHPAMVRKACEQLGVDPKDAVVIGDHKVDMKAGRAAGCKVIGIGTEGDYTLDELCGLLEILAW